MTDKLYSPWRYPYLRMDEPGGCIFCIRPEDDEKRLVVYRSLHCFIIMNLYPYNNGHLMVIPNRHLSCLNDLNKAESDDLFALLKLSVRVIKKRYGTDGMNIGINLGKAAGAGVDEHLHIHIVPRWFGDVNYMTTCADSRVIPEDFQQAYKGLKELFLELKNSQNNAETE